MVIAPSNPSVTRAVRATASKPMRVGLTRCAPRPKPPQVRLSYTGMSPGWPHCTGGRGCPVELWMTYQLPSLGRQTA
jgi:hypothetical protein